ncbi:MAG: RIP metalloprotease RseP [Candidatus Margulisbacteria bacterium]|nr:RIP metalloprotease RseP [Candidatus Margulisiibacteriota bacterium]
MITVIIALLLISVLILVHEGGHFFIARLFKVKVFEYSIGFGPVFLKKRFNDTQFSLRFFPFGGFVRLAGIDSSLPEEQYRPEESYERLNYWQKTLVLAAGSISNLIFGFLLLFLLLFFFGKMEGLSTRIEKVIANTPAQAMDLREGDKVLKVNSQAVSDGEQVVKLIRSSKGQPLEFIVQRNNGEIKFLLNPSYHEKDKIYFVGIKLQPMLINRYSLIFSLKEGVKEFNSISLMTLYGLEQFFTGHVSMDQVAGPLGIVSLTGEMVNYGVTFLFRFIVILSINLAILNLFPFPALDGGRILLLNIEKVLGKVVKPEIINRLNYIGALILLLFIIYVTYFDLRRIFIKPS